MVGPQRVQMGTTSSPAYSTVPVIFAAGGSGGSGGIVSASISGAGGTGSNSSAVA